MTDTSGELPRLQETYRQTLDELQKQEKIITLRVSREAEKLFEELQVELEEVMDQEKTAEKASERIANAFCGVWEAKMLGGREKEPVGRENATPQHVALVKRLDCALSALFGRLA